MKLLNDNQTDKVILRVETTGKTTKDIYLPKRNIHFWYPFNLNFSYKYTDAKDFLYLVKDKKYKGENYYDVTVLKKAKPLAQRNGVPFHPAVFHRNTYIMGIARDIGVPTIKDQVTMEEIEKGFNTVSDTLLAVKRIIEERYLEEVQEDAEVFLPTYTSEEWDKAIYSYRTEREQEVLIELGEMYVMLNLMRKLSEGR